MRKFARTAVLAAAVAVLSTAIPALSSDLSPTLQSFATSQAISAYEVSATGVAGFALEPQFRAALNSDGAAVGGDTPVTMNSFSSSVILAPHLALDSGAGLDVASRFTNYNSAAITPFLTSVSAPYLGLANGGRYSGMTYAPASNLRIRFGTAINSERLDHFSFDPLAPEGNLGLVYDASQTKSLLSGFSWDLSRAMGLDVTAISSQRNGVPLGFAGSANIAQKATTNAFGVAAHLDITPSWIMTTSFSQGMTQLDQRANLDGSLHEQTYSLAIAKQGLFGDDALGLSLSRPSPSLVASFSSLAGSGELPPLIITPQAQTTGLHSPETDFQLGYITNFLNGAVALQTNAGYQLNYEGQSGATSLSLLSRAKIKF